MVPEADVDPASDLALLKRAKSSVALDQVLDFGPWWYAPLLATLIGGLTIFGNDVSEGTNRIAGVVAVIAGALVAWHDYRRRPVRPKPSRRSAPLVAVVVVGLFVVMSLWGTAVSSTGFDRLFPGYAAVGWLLTTAVLLGVRSVLHVARKKRVILS